MNIKRIGWAVHSCNYIHPEVYANHIACLLRASRCFPLVLLVLNGVKVAKARNTLVAEAQKRQCSHIFFADDDHLFPVEAIELLASNDAAAVSGLVCKRKAPYPQVGFVLRPDGYHPIVLPLNGKSFEVDVAAMGCTLVDMRVFDKMERPYFRDTVEPLAGREGFFNKRSDINFFEEVRRQGEVVRIDTRVIVKHMGEPYWVDPTEHYETLLSAAKLEGQELKAKVSNFRSLKDGHCNDKGPQEPAQGYANREANVDEFRKAGVS